MTRKRLALSLLFASLPATVLAQNYSGSVDSANCATITGWAWDSTQPNGSINVDLYSSTTPIATVSANLYRADLFAQGYGNGYHGFSFTVPSTLLDGNAHSIYAYISGTQIALTHSGSYSISCPANSSGYQPYYSDGLTSINLSKWTQNGSVSAGSGGLTATSSSGGSIISSVAVPDGTADYEVRSKLTLAARVISSMHVLQPVSQKSPCVLATRSKALTCSSVSNPLQP